MVFVPVFQRPFSATFDRRAAAVDWSTWFDYCWLFKGAASRSSSYVDVVSAATLEVLDQEPSWSAATGLSFTSGTNDQLDTTITGGNSWSAVIRIGATDQQFVACFGETTTTANATRLNIYPRYYGPRSYFRSGGNYDQSTVYGSGAVLAVTPAKAYAAGSPLGDITDAWTGSTSSTIILGGQNINGRLVERWQGAVLAFGLKNGTLTDSEISAASTAMAAL